MSDLSDKPKSPDALAAGQIYAARIRGAYSIATLSALARVDPEAIVELENGALIVDAGAQDRVMDVLGLRPDGHLSPVRLADLNSQISD